MLVGYYAVSLRWQQFDYFSEATHYLSSGSALSSEVLSDKNTNTQNSTWIRHQCSLYGVVREQCPQGLTFLHNLGAGNSGLKLEHHDLQQHRGNRRMWPLQHPLSSCTLEHTCSIYSCEDHNTPSNSNRNFHHDLQLSTT